MIIRIIAVDPRPRDPRRDTVVYQVPENSREEGLLRELLETAGVEYIIFNEVNRKKEAQP